MTEYFAPALEPAATAGNLTNLVAERAWFEPERIMVSRPLGDGWQPVTAREFEAEIRATAKGLIASGVQIGDRVAIMARTRYEWTILDFAKDLCSSVKCTAVLHPEVFPVSWNQEAMYVVRSDEK